MIYNNKLIQDIEKIYSERRRQAESAVETVKQTLFANPEYLKLYNQYNATRFDISKAKFLGEDDKATALTKSAKQIKSDLLKLQLSLGVSDKDLTPKYTCKECKDTGKTDDGKRCKCFKKMLAKLTLEELGVDKKKLPSFKKATHLELNNLDKIYEKMKQYCDIFPNTEKNIVISGTVGTGKSYLAGCIANELISKDFNVVFISACELNSILIKYHTAPVDEKGVYLDLLISCDLLVIDDLGSEPIYKNVTEEYLLMIITERMLKGNPFIITTNLEQEQLLDRYGDRTLSRLNDKRHGVFIQIKGEDLRRKKK